MSENHHFVRKCVVIRQVYEFKEEIYFCKKDRNFFSKVSE